MFNNVTVPHNSSWKKQDALRSSAASSSLVVYPVPFMCSLLLLDVGIGYLWQQVEWA